MAVKDSLNDTYADCICINCGDSGCNVKLDKLSHDHILISGTKYQEVHNYTDNLCDFIVFDCVSQTLIRLAVVELKGGNVDSDDISLIHKQLQNGASVTDMMVKGSGVEEFIPFLVKGKRIDPMVPKILIKEKFKIRFRSFHKSIRIIRCESSLEFHGLTTM